MLKQSIGTSTAILLAIVVQNAGAIGALIPVPMILSAEVDAVQYRLIISGTNFGSAPPLVMLGGQALAVSGSSSNRVVVDLPADLRPASYLLTIRNKRDHSKADSFNLQIPAARKDLASLPRDE
ncbi:MAG: hypothetical protein ACREXJ_02270 [Gammaproteobacteria bacterium]